jgi:hypothetical protein
MQIDEIRVGATYKCRGGYLRRVVRIEGDGSAAEVIYEWGWLPELIRSIQRGPLLWFATTARSVISG